MNKKQPVLGRGLDALFGNAGLDAGSIEDSLGFEKEGKSKNIVQNLKLDEIIANSGQPRLFFDDLKLQELAGSIKEQGVLQPILVRPLDKKLGTEFKRRFDAESGRESDSKIIGEFGSGFGVKAIQGKNICYEIIAGERRWRAAQLAGLVLIPAIIKNLNREEALAIALIENLQREDLNPIEEAKGYEELKDSYGLTQEQIATKVGKSRSTVANSLRLLQLPEQIQEDLKKDLMSIGHARPLLIIDEQAVLIKLRDGILKYNLSVREVEKLVNHWKLTGSLLGTRLEADAQLPLFDQDSNTEKNEKNVNPRLQSIAVTLSKHLGVKVTAKGDEDKGKFILSFSSLPELVGILEKLNIDNQL